MHIPDGFLDPKTATGLGMAAMGVLAYSISKVKQAISEPAVQKVLAGVNQSVNMVSDKARKVIGNYGQQYLLKVGMVASLIFAAQMFNFPISNGTSGHLLGGVLAAVLLGPFGGTIALSAVLVVQSLFYADGGLLALGANIINMAFFGSFLGYYMYAFFKKFVGFNFSILAASWLSVVLAAIACSLEIAFSGTMETLKIFFAMVPVHAAIGIVEAMITLALVSIVRFVMEWEIF